MKFKVISLDMFQTLVDLNSRSDETCKRILGEKYSKEYAEMYWKEAGKIIFRHFNRNEDNMGPFMNVRTAFEVCYTELFNQLKIIDIDPVWAAGILVSQHSFSASYEDSESFLYAVEKLAPVCLVTDADRDMVLPLLERFPFDKAFISEDYQSYKIEPNSRLFDALIRHYDVEPQEILHIGDGYADIIGANRAGITTCWLNRRNSEWDHAVKPDYTVHSLVELIPLLGIES